MSAALPSTDPSRQATHAGGAPALPAVPGARRAGTTVSITSEQLFGNAGEVQILHRGALYRLKQTSLGKLILTK